MSSMALAQTVVCPAQALHSLSGVSFRIGSVERVQLLSSARPLNHSPCGIWRSAEEESRGRVQCRAKVFNVEMIHNGETFMLEVPEDETILSVAMEKGLDVPYDCKLGVCMTCPAKLEKGAVNQSDGMLSDDVIERGFALMCAAYPLSDCTIRTIPEEDLLALQLATADDA